MKIAVILAEVGFLVLSSEAMSCYSTDPLADQIGPAIEFRTDAKGVRVAIAGGVEYRPVMDKLGQRILGFQSSRWGWLGGEFLLQPMKNLAVAPDELRKLLELISVPEGLEMQSALCDLNAMTIDLGYFGVHPLFGGQLQSATYWIDSIVQWPLRGAESY